MGPTILAVVSDLLVVVRIEEAAKRLGASVETATPDDAARFISASRPRLVVIDLAVPGVDLKLMTEAAKEEGASVVGFYPHVETALRRAASKAGILYVYPRSRFLRDLPNILGDAL